MKNCSYCGRENEDAAVVCLECATEFQPKPDPAADAGLTDPALSLVILATFRNVVDAGMLKTRLEAGGIEACIPEELTPQIFWYAVTSPLERVTVRVAAKDYEAAKEILDDGTTGGPPPI
jgi:hypothetical protein